MLHYRGFLGISRDSFFCLAKKRRPACGRQAQREVIKPLRTACGRQALRLFASTILFSQRREVAKRSLITFAALRLCESIFFRLSKKESLPQASRQYSLFSRKVGKTCLRKAGTKRSHTTFAALPLCESIFFRLSKEESLRRGTFNIYSTPA